MTHQALLLEDLQPCRAPYQTFFQNFGPLGICALPAEVLDDTPLFDPDTGLPLPSLRESCSQDGELCYAHVFDTCAEGLYWANVAATPYLAEAERVILTEAHLVYALAWDERLFWRTPTQILRAMQARAEELMPCAAALEPASAIVPFSAPSVPLTVVTTVEVTPEELRAAFEATAAPHLAGTPTCTAWRQATICRVQQGLLRTLERALRELLETETDSYTAHVLETLCALVERVRAFQQQTRQRVVNAVRTWDPARNAPAWALTLGAPAALLAAA
jgi:hypothetical protein